MIIVAYILIPRGISNAACSAMMKIHFALLVDFAITRAMIVMTIVVDLGSTGH